MRLKYTLWLLAVVLCGCAPEGLHCARWGCEKFSWPLSIIYNGCDQPAPFDERCGRTEDVDHFWNKPDPDQAKESDNGKQCLEGHGDVCEKWSEVSEAWKKRKLDGYYCPMIIAYFRGYEPPPQIPHAGELMFCMDDNRACIADVKNFLKANPDCHGHYSYPDEK